jgi:hypothetical protein
MLRKPPITGQFSNVPGCLTKENMQESLRCGVTLYYANLIPM